MKRSKSARFAVVMLSLALVVCPARVGAAPAQADFLSTVPADALLCVRLNNMDASIGALDQYLAGVAPVPPLAMMIRMQLGNLLGDPSLAGINTAGSFGVFAMARDADSAPQVFIILPVSDKKALAASPAISKPNTNGVSAITPTNTAGQSANVMLSLGDHVIVCPAEQAATLAGFAKPKAAGMLQSLTPVEKAAATSAPLWTRVNMARVNSLYGGTMATKFKQFKNIPGVMGGAQGSNVVMDVYFAAILSLMKQLQAFDISVTPKADSLAITSMLIATPKSKLAEMLALGPVPKGSPELTAYLKDGVLLNIYMRFNKPMLKKGYATFFDLLARATSGATQQEIEKSRALVSKFIDAAGDCGVASMRGMPFAVDNVMQVRDEKAMRDGYRESMAVMNSGIWADIYKGSGVTMTPTFVPAASNYKGIPIDSWVMNIKPVATNSPEAKMVMSIYGDGMKGSIAFVKGLALSSFDKDGGEAVVKRLIDDSRAGGPATTSAEFKTAMAMVPDAANADFIATYNLLRLFGAFAGISPVPGMATAIAALPPSKSNLVLAGRAANGMCAMDIVIPKQHAMEIVSVFMQMQGGGGTPGSGMGQPSRGGMTPPKPARAQPVKGAVQPAPGPSR